MLLTTIPNLGGREFEILGMVHGSMVQSKNMFHDIGAGFKNMVGGEITSYTEMMKESRETATARMIEQAYNMGADAIIGISYNTSSIMQGAAEVLATGTAVKMK